MEYPINEKRKFIVTWTKEIEFDDAEIRHMGFSESPYVTDDERDAYLDTLLGEIEPSEYDTEEITRIE